MLSSCADVPDNVKTDSKNVSDKGTSQAHDSEPEIISVDSLADDIQTALSQDHGQFSLSESCNVNIPEALYKCTFITNKDFAENYKEVFSSVAGIDEIKSEYLTKDSDFMGDGYVYNDPESQVYAAISDSGFISMYSGEMYSADFGSFPIREIYVNGMDNWSGTASQFDFNGTDFSVEKAVSICENWIGEKLENYEIGIEYKPLDIFRIENESGNEILAVEFEKYYNGVKLSSFDDYDIPDTDESYTAVKNSSMEFFITGDGEISAFTTGTGSLSPNNQSQLSECISLTSAFKLIEDKFSDYNELDVIGVNLKYVLKYNVESAFEMPLEENVENKTELVWEFTIDPKYPNFDESDETSVPCFLYINVNAETGDIDFLLNSAGRSRGV
jgi:hypothetical protein